MRLHQKTSVLDLTQFLPGIKMYSFLGPIIQAHDPMIPEIKEEILKGTCVFSLKGLQLKP